MRDAQPQEPLEDGGFVLIERERGGLTETTIRRVDNGGKSLITWSKNPKLASELGYPSADPGETIRVVGVVTAIQVPIA